MNEERPAWQEVVTGATGTDGDASEFEPDPLPPLHLIPEDRVHDSREDTDWFRGLPGELQDELRERWRHNEGAGARHRARRNRNMRTYAVEMAGAYVFLVLALGGLSLQVVALAALMGTVAGSACVLFRASTPIYTALFVTGFMATALIGGVVNNPIYLVYLSVFTVGLGGVLGVSHQLQRFDGSE